MSVASRTILSNFFEEQCPQSHPQYLSGLSRALFPTTFLEIAVNVLLNNGVIDTNDTIQGEYNANLSIVSHVYVQIEHPTAYKSAKQRSWSRVENPLEALQNTTLSSSSIQRGDLGA